MGRLQNGHKSWSQKQRSDATDNFCAQYLLLGCGGASHAPCQGLEAMMFFGNEPKPLPLLQQVHEN